MLTKFLRLSGGDHLHTGTVVGKLEGDRASTLGWIDLLREPSFPKTARAASSSTRIGARCRGGFAVASGGIHVWHMPALVRSSATIRCCSSAAARSAIPGAPLPVHANRVALEACVQARNEGRDLTAEGPRILAEAAADNPELATALETWRSVKFEFQTVDTLDTTIV